MILNVLKGRNYFTHAIGGSITQYERTSVSLWCKLTEPPPHPTLHHLGYCTMHMKSTLSHVLFRLIFYSWSYRLARESIDNTPSDQTRPRSTVLMHKQT